MRLVKLSVTLIALLALLGWVAARLPAQTKPPSQPAPKTQQGGKAPAPPKQARATLAKTPQPSKAAQAAKKQPVKPAPKAKPPQQAKTSVRPAPVPEPRVFVARRDPFDPLVGKTHPGGGLSEHLPPGKAGLVVSTLRLDGLVRGPNGMIAVVSNPQQRVYFLREGDQLYDGRVERITMEGVSFHETGKDAFGKPVERLVTKRLYPSVGEQR